jgi:hypothetical protein
MAAPVVVQGTHVANPNSYSDQPTPSAPTPSANFTGKGEKQESKCRDPLFALVRTRTRTVHTYGIQEDDSFHPLSI